MPEGTPFGNRVEQFTEDTLSPFAVPMIGKALGAGAGALGSQLGKAKFSGSLADKLASSVIFQRSKRVINDPFSDEIEFKETALTKELRNDGVLQGPRPVQWVKNYERSLDNIATDARGVLTKSVGPKGETLGDAPANLPLRMTSGPNGPNVEVVLPRAEKFINDTSTVPSVRADMESLMREWRQLLQGYPIEDPATGQITQVPGVNTISDLLEKRKAFYLDNASSYKAMRSNPEILPEQIDQLMRAAGQDITDFLTDNINATASRLGKKAQDVASGFAPINAKWSRYIDAQKDFRKLADTISDPRKSIVRMGPGIGGAVLGAAGSTIGLGLPGMIAGGALGTPQGIAAASWAAHGAENVLGAMSPMAGTAAHIAAPVAGAIQQGLMSPRAMSIPASFDQFMGNDAHAAPILPRTADGVRSNPAAIKPLLPPDMQGEFDLALRGDDDAINQFMQKALTVSPALQQAFAPSRVSQEEFGGQFQDPMARFQLFQEVTSQMLREDIDPRKAYRAQKDVAQGRVPKMMQ